MVYACKRGEVHIDFCSLLLLRRVIAFEEETLYFITDTRTAVRVALHETFFQYDSNAAGEKSQTVV